MLKIKDNVDLEELKNFGFFKNNWSDKGYSYIVPDLNESGRTEVQLHVGDYGHLTFEWDDHLYGLNVPSVIFDLIEAGLVEKVKAV